MGKNLPVYFDRAEREEFKRRVQHRSKRGALLVTAATEIGFVSIADLSVIWQSASAVAIGIGSFLAAGWVERWWRGFHIVPIRMLCEKVQAVKKERSESATEATKEIAKLKKQIDDLTDQLDSEWRAARIEFEADYENHKRALQPFLTTVKNMLIATGRRQVTSTWNEYLPVPPGVDDDLYYLFEDLWRNGWPRLLDEANLDGLKGTFHSIRGFFDRMYDLLEDFPEHAPAYVDRNVKPDQYDALHVVWHLGHAFDAVLHGNQKADKPPSRWDRLWRKWNTGVMIPSDPTIRITPSIRDSEAPHRPAPEGEHPET